MVGKYYLPRLDNQSEEDPLLTFISNSTILVVSKTRCLSSDLKISFCVLRDCRNGTVYKCLNGIKVVVTSTVPVFPQNHTESYQYI